MTTYTIPCVISISPGIYEYIIVMLGVQGAPENKTEGSKYVQRWVQAPNKPHQCISRGPDYVRAGAVAGHLSSVSYGRFMMLRDNVSFIFC